MADYLLSSNASNCPLTGQALAYRADRPRHLVANQAFPFVAPVPAEGCDFHRHFVLGHDLFSLSARIARRARGLLVSGWASELAVRAFFRSFFRSNQRFADRLPARHAVIAFVAPYVHFHFFLVSARIPPGAGCC